MRDALKSSQERQNEAISTQEKQKPNRTIVTSKLQAAHPEPESTADLLGGPSTGLRAAARGKGGRTVR